MSSRSPFGVGILGTGRALGSRLHTNEELCSTTLRSTTPDWIVQKTGIRQRHLLGHEQSASSLALAAAKAAMETSGVQASDLDLIVVCTFSGEYVFPPASARLFRDLGATRAQVFDVQANCAGFVTGLTVAADRLFMDEDLRYALVVGLEVLSPYTDWSDIETAIYFSDGAGAAVLGRVPHGDGLQAAAFWTDTSNFESVRLRGGGSGFPYTAASASAGSRSLGFMEMNGLATWKQAVTHLPPTVRRACEKAGITPHDIDLFVFHQANQHLIEYTMKKLRVPVERAYVHVQEVGNAGAASIPIALDAAVEAGLVHEGQRMVLSGVGAGFNFSASVWVWAGVPAGPSLAGAGGE